MESQNDLVCKGPVKVSHSTSLKASLNAAHDLVQLSFECLKGWKLSWRKKCFIIFKWNFLDFNLCLLSLLFILCPSKTSLALSPLYSPSNMKLTTAI